jgi:hypothetical protein
MLLGKPGTFVTLPVPTGQVAAPPDLGEAVHELLDGNAAVDYAAGDVKTRWSFEWEGVTPDEAGVLRAFFTRQRGRGPWVMYLPELRHNVLAPNVASTSGPLGTTAGWGITASVGEALVAQPASAGFGRTPFESTLEWSLPAAVTGGILRVDSPAVDYFGYPVASGQVWSFAAWLRSSTPGADTAFNGRAGLTWYDSTGAVLSSTIPSYAAITTTYGLKTVAAATAPASACYVRPYLQIDPTTVSGTAVVRVSGAHLEMASSVLSVLPGDGLSRVSVLAPGRDFPVAEWSSIKAQFQEV